MTEKKPDTAARTPRDPAGTIRRIAAAAREVFGEAGFDAAKMEHIARRAGVSKQLVYFYFNGKDQLYSELVKTVSRTSYERVLAIDFANMEPLAAIEAYIKEVFNQFAEDHITAVLTMDQSLHDGALVQLPPEVRKLRQKQVDLLEAALRRGRDAGVFGDHVDAVLLEFMTLIIVSGCVSSRRMFERYIGEEQDGDHSIEFWRRYVADFILRAIRP